MQWDRKEYARQLENSQKLWKRLEELDGVDTPEQLMDVLFQWISERAPRDNQELWEEKFKEAFGKFSAGELLPPVTDSTVDG